VAAGLGMGFRVGAGAVPVVRAGLVSGLGLTVVRRVELGAGGLGATGVSVGVLVNAESG
jgi:hypothetical protein